MPHSSCINQAAIVCVYGCLTLNYLSAAWITNSAKMEFAHADASIAVTNHCQSSETENTAAFNNLGNTIDRNHFFANAVVLFLGNCVFGILCHLAIP